MCHRVKQGYNDHGYYELMAIKQIITLFGPQNKVYKVNVHCYKNVRADCLVFVIPEFDCNLKIHYKLH